MACRGAFKECAPWPYEPQLLYEGNRVFGAADISIKVVNLNRILQPHADEIKPCKALGIHELSPFEFCPKKLKGGSNSNSDPPEVSWVEIPISSIEKKRKRNPKPKLALEVL